MGRPYKTINFDENWAENIQKYLEKHPEEGFESDEVKGFIKNVMNKYMAEETGLYTKEEIKMLKDMTELED
jgi:hypothetical protein